MKNPPDVLVLLSGGIDSAACVSFFQRQRHQVSALFVDYGQVAADKERNAALEISRHFEIDLRQIRCEGMSNKAGGYVPGRNAFLVFLAVMQMQFDAGLISMGIHSGTDYWDCSEQFAKACQHFLDAYCGGKVRLNFPFLSWNKRQIWEFCRGGEVPLGVTYSCELGVEQPCGRCSSCSDLEALLAF